MVNQTQIQSTEPVMQVLGNHNLLPLILQYLSEEELFIQTRVNHLFRTCAYNLLTQIQSTEPVMQVLGNHNLLPLILQCLSEEELFIQTRVNHLFRTCAYNLLMKEPDKWFETNYRAEQVEWDKIFANFAKNHKTTLDLPKYLLYRIKQCYQFYLWRFSRSKSEMEVYLSDIKFFAQNPHSDAIFPVILNKKFETFSQDTEKKTQEDYRTYNERSFIESCIQVNGKSSKFACHLNHGPQNYYQYSLQEPSRVLPKLLGEGQLELMVLYSIFTRSSLANIYSAGKNILHACIDKGNLKLIKLVYSTKDCILEGVDLRNIERNAKPPPLCYAISEGKLDIAKFLVDLGADVNVVTTHEPVKEVPQVYSALTALAQRGIDWETGMELLNGKKTFQLNRYHIASLCRSGCYYLIPAALEYQKLSMAGNSNEQSVLRNFFMQVMGDIIYIEKFDVAPCIHALEKIIEKGADIDALEYDRPERREVYKTHLHYLIEYYAGKQVYIEKELSSRKKEIEENFLALLAALLKYKPNLKLVDSQQNKTPITLAEEAGLEKVVNVLKKKK